MKKYFLLFILFSLFGCENFLKVEPREAISINEQFSTLEGFKLALNGAYFKTEDLVSSNYFFYPDAIGGNIIFSPTRTGANLGEISKFIDLSQTYDFNDNAIESDFKNFYENSYKVINNVNNIIFYLQSLNEGTLLQIQQIKAEALAIRAFVHYNLLQLYSQNYGFSNNANHKGIAYVDNVLIGNAFTELLSIKITSGPSHFTS